MICSCGKKGCKGCKKGYAQGAAKVTPLGYYLGTDNVDPFDNVEGQQVAQGGSGIVVGTGPLARQSTPEEELASYALQEGMRKGVSLGTDRALEYGKSLFDKTGEGAEAAGAIAGVADTASTAVDAADTLSTAVDAADTLSTAADAASAASDVTASASPLGVAKAVADPVMDLADDGTMSKSGALETGSSILGAIVGTFLGGNTAAGASAGKAAGSVLTRASGMKGSEEAVKRASKQMQAEVEKGPDQTALAAVQDPAGVPPLSSGIPPVDEPQNYLDEDKKEGYQDGTTKVPLAYKPDYRRLSSGGMADLNFSKRTAEYNRKNREAYAKKIEELMKQSSGR
jgi:hypothetical protein